MQIYIHKKTGKKMFLLKKYTDLGLYEIVGSEHFSKFQHKVIRSKRICLDENIKECVSGARQGSLF